MTGRIGKRMLAGLGVGLVLCVSSSSFGQITRAGAVGTVNPVPTAFRGGVRSGVHHGHRGGFRSTSRGFAGGGIGYSSTVHVGLGSGLSCGYGGRGAHYHRGFRCGYGYPAYWYAGNTTYGGWPLWEQDRRVYIEPPVVVLPEPVVDEGIAALESGRFVEARLIYLRRAEERREAEESGEQMRVDRSDLRLAGFAAAGEHRFAEAERLMTEAYAEDSSLVLDPLSGSTLVGGTRAMRALVTGAVAHAHRVERAGAWDVVAWLMQAEGRHDMARKMAARAKGMREGAAIEAGGDGERFAAVVR